MFTIITYLRAFAILAVVSTSAFGRVPFDPPTASELLEKSDLVCILQVLSIQQSSKPEPDILPGDEVQWYTAKCKIICVFKGDNKTNEVQIPYYGHFFDEPEMRGKAPLVETTQRQHQVIQYLAFLQIGQNGYFYPTSGHFDPGL